jgi:hypothetical protein
MLDLERITQQDLTDAIREAESPLHPWQAERISRAVLKLLVEIEARQKAERTARRRSARRVH